MPGKKPWSVDVMQRNFKRIVEQPDLEINAGPLWDKWVQKAPVLASGDIHSLSVELLKKGKTVGDSDAKGHYLPQTTQEPEEENPAILYGEGDKVYAASHSRIGFRASQEDRLIVQRLDITKQVFEATNVEDYAKAFYDAVVNTGKEVNAADIGVAGSCFIGNLQIGRKIIAANLGDSNCIVILRNKNTGEFSRQILNWWQKPHTPAEKARIEDLGGAVIWGRVNGSLAVARSFGDKTHVSQDTKKQPLISYQPELTMYEVPEDCDAWVINCCDGVSDVVRSSEIVDIFAHSYQERNDAKTLEDFETNLLGVAYSRPEANDNFTITAVKVDPDRATFSAVLDGHGGKQVSTLAKELIEKNVANVAPFKPSQIIAHDPVAQPQPAAKHTAAVPVAEPDLVPAFRVCGQSVVSDNPQKNTHPVIQCFHAPHVVVKTPSGAAPKKGMAGAVFYYPKNMPVDQLDQYTKNVVKAMFVTVLIANGASQVLIDTITANSEVFLFKKIGSSNPANLNILAGIRHLAGKLNEDETVLLNKIDNLFRGNPATTNIKLNGTGNSTIADVVLAKLKDPTLTSEVKPFDRVEMLKDVHIMGADVTTPEKVKEEVDSKIMPRLIAQASVEKMNAHPHTQKAHKEKEDEEDLEVSEMTPALAF